MEQYRRAKIAENNKGKIEQAPQSDLESACDSLASEIRGRNGMPLDEVVNYLEGLDTLSQQKPNDNIDKLQRFFRIRDTDVFEEDDQKSRDGNNQIFPILSSPGTNGLLSTLIDYPELYTFHTGLMLSQSNVFNLPKEIIHKLDLKTAKPSVRLKPYHKKWYMCAGAENMKKFAEDDQAFVSVSDNETPLVLVKFYGKISGVCLENFAAEDGRTFIKGNWYSPIGDKTIDTLHDAFIADKTIAQADSSEWALMRALRPRAGRTLANELNLLSQIARGLPEKWDNHELLSGLYKFRFTRAEYFKRYSESNEDLPLR